MKKGLLITLAFFVLNACDSSGFKTKVPEIQACACVPPPFKPLPQKAMDDAIAHLRQYAILAEELKPTIGILEGGIPQISENCHIKRKSTLINSHKIIETVSALNLPEKICPITYYREILLTNSSSTISSKGFHKTNFQAHTDSVFALIGVGKIQLNGPIHKVKQTFALEKGRREVLKTETSQEGFVVFSEWGQVPARTIQKESREYIVSEDGASNPSEVKVEKFLALSFETGAVVFQWTMSTDKKSESPNVSCSINGADISGTELCEIF